jgi:hypothetical protein
MASRILLARHYHPEIDGSKPGGTKPWGGDLKTKNYWIWGKPGTGKSKWAHEQRPKASYSKPINKWWDGFSHRIEVVIIDDWDPSKKMLASHLKVWADRDEITAEVKGGSVMIWPG